MFCTSRCMLSLITYTNLLIVSSVFTIILLFLINELVSSNFLEIVFLYITLGSISKYSRAKFATVLSLVSFPEVCKYFEKNHKVYSIK